MTRPSSASVLTGAEERLEPQPMRVGNVRKIANRNARRSMVESSGACTTPLRGPGARRLWTFRGVKGLGTLVDRRRSIGDNLTEIERRRAECRHVPMVDGGARLLACEAA